MKKFNFRLEKVLDYREMVEQWAKDVYLDARSTRLEAEIKIYEIAMKRQELIYSVVRTVEDRMNMQNQLQILDDREREQRLVVDLLLQEEERALETWTEKKVDVEALSKLREKSFAQWQLEMDRKMQNELDEWSLRRKAA